MYRRNFIKTISLSSLALSKISGKNFINDYNEPQALIKPAKLKKGDTIGLIAPGSFITKDELKKSINNLNQLGFNVYYTKNILKKYGYLAGTDKQRADDIHEMFRSQNIKGIVAARGGYGCSRILSMLDYDLIKNNPKPFIGYSDVTSLFYAIFSKTGLVCFHGPFGISTFNDYTIKYLNNVLVFPEENLEIKSAAENNNDEAYKVVTIKKGIAKGKLTGGNLTLAATMIGTPYDINSEGKILFFEETDEEPYRIDRMLTHLIQAGKFDNAAGVILGVFKNIIPKSTGIQNSFSLKEVLIDRLSQFDFPIIYGMSFGHVINKFTIPFGIEAEIDSLNQKITLLEPACL